MQNRVELINITKSFHTIPVLKNVNFSVKAGEIHGLVGENGAGKSTLMKILSGAYQMDSGKILLDGNEVKFRNPFDSRRMGIGIIYQELTIVPDLSVAENIYLHQLTQTGWWMPMRKINNRAAQLIKSIGFDIKPTLRAGSLSIAWQQVIEIAKALSENIKVLVLDEPTSVLGPHESKKLFEVLKRLKNEGVAIIFISHRLEEIFQLCDKVSVLKDGHASDSFFTTGIDRNGIISLMLGRALNTMFPVTSKKTGGEILRAEGLSTKDKVKNVSISLREGEILGITGLVGSGKSELIRSVFAADKKIKGDIFLSGNKSELDNPHDAVRAGIGLVPEDRKNDGIILNRSIRENISLANYKKTATLLGFIHRKREDHFLGHLIESLGIKTRSFDLESGKLSGGNQQKVVLAKWLGRACRILLIDEPTRGVDVGAKIEIYDLINRLAANGTGIIIVSSESAELMGLCDRIMIMHKGIVTGVLNKDEFSEENILRLAIS
jgi:ribose transport system ATP-binding protein